MVASVQAVPRARIGIDQGRPLNVRWEELRARVCREIPLDHQLRGTANSPCSEGSVDAMRDALERWRYEAAIAAVPPDYDSPPWQRVRDAGMNLRKRYHEAWCGLQQTNSKIYQGAVCHQILEDVVPDYQVLPRRIFTANDEFPRCQSVTEEMAANKAFESEVLAIEAKFNAVTAALASQAAWAGLPEVTRNLFEAMLGRLIKCEHAADAVRQENRDLKRNPSKRGKHRKAAMMEARPQ